MKAHYKIRNKIAIARSTRLCAAVLPLDQMRGLPRLTLRKEHAQLVGVYFLWEGPYLVYVGSSVCIRNRVKAHVKEKGAVFTHTTFLVTHRSLIRRIEESYIQAYTPPLNAQLRVLCWRRT